MLIELMKEMFEEMVLKKNATLIKKYYHPELLLYTNGEAIDYDAFLSSHIEYYQSSKEYDVQYDEETFVESADKCSARIWITVTVPGSFPKKMEVILILQYKEGKIWRVWELTYPNWAQLPEFSEGSKL